MYIQKCKAISELFKNSAKLSLLFKEKFTDSINRLVIIFKAVYLKPKSSTFLEVLTSLYKAIDFNNALASEDT